MSVSFVDQFVSFKRIIGQVRYAIGDIVWNWKRVCEG